MQKNKGCHMNDKKQRLNVLLITGDHIRHDAMGCNGNPFVKTPVLDRLAGEGVTFQNSFSPDPICVPGRAVITTGNYPHKCTGNKGNSGRIGDDQIKIASHFADHGYRTYALGKLHYVPYAKPGEPRLLHGFQHAELCEEGRILNQFSCDKHTPGLEEYHDYLHEVGWGGYERAHGIGNNDIRPGAAPMPAEHYVDRWAADRTIAALEQHLAEEEGTPFFTWMSFTKPHSPYDPPEPYHRLYDPREIPEPLGAAGDADGLDQRAPCLTLGKHSHRFERVSPQAIQMARAYYYGMVTLQDECIGRVVDFLEARKIRENTIIVYTGDHGDLLGDFGAFYKANFLNGSTRIPSVWSCPACIPAGQKPDSLMGLQDVLPTLAAMTDTPLPAEVDGMDLAPIMAGDTTGERELYIGQCGGPGSQQYMACTKESKYIYSEINGIEELYDLVKDPDEKHNIAADQAEKTAAMRSIVIDWCRANGDTAMLDGEDLVRKDMDIQDHLQFRADSMGWRYY
jgi:arylsulfatase